MIKKIFNLPVQFLFMLLLGVTSATIAEPLVAGDNAPRGARDGVLNAADLVVMERFVLGLEIPTAEELKVADVAPLGFPDGILNVADLLVVKRAVLGLVTLPPINLGPDVPVINSVASTTLNPLPITGTAVANSLVHIYVNGVEQSVAVVNSSGVFSASLVLLDGDNSVYGITEVGGDFSFASPAFTVNYDNILPRTQSGVISEDTVWTSGASAQPYIVSGGNLTVNAGVKLIIQPGVQVRFEAGRNLTINGTLVVNGTASSQVKFTRDAISGTWGGIVIGSNATNVVIDFASVEWAVTGVQVTGAANVLIKNSLIQHHTSYGVYFSSNATGTISGNTFEDITNRAIFFNNASPGVIGNLVRTSGTGIHLLNASPVIQGNMVQQNSRGIYIEGATSAIINNGNIISDNTIYGINLYGASNPDPIITANTITRNGSTVTVSTGNSNITTSFFTNYLNITRSAQGNWWGTADVNQISKGVSKTSVSGLAAGIDFSLFLDGPGGSVVSDNFIASNVTTGKIILAGEHYYVINNVKVLPGVTLQIEQGAVLEFVDGILMTVDGTLQVNGVSENQVLFTTASATPARGIWKGLELTSTSNLVDLNYLKMEWVYVGFDINGAVGVTLRNSHINNYSWRGAYFHNGATGTIDNCVIGSDYVSDSYGATYGIGAYVVGASANIRNSFFHSAADGIKLESATGVILDNNDVRYNGIGIRILNSSPQITGNSVNNNLTGVHIEGNSTPNIINSNEIHTNGSGILVTSSFLSPLHYPRPVINNNAIYSNAYNIKAESTSSYDASSIVLDARFNWWGTTSISSISNLIFDRADYWTTPNRYPAVDASSFLDGPNGSVYPALEDIGGELTVSTVLTANTAYSVTRNLHVPAGITLTVPAGVRFYFSNNAQLLVDGTLEVSGSAASPVMFLPESETISSLSTWNGIVLNSTSTATIDYAHIKYAKTGIFINGTNNSIIRHAVIIDFFDDGVRYQSVASGIFTDNIIGDMSNPITTSKSAGIRLIQSGVTIQNNIIRYVYRGIYLDRSSSIITSNYIHNCGSAAIYVTGNNSNPHITLNVMSDNNSGIAIVGTGNGATNPLPVINNNDIYNYSNYALFLSGYDSSTGSIVDMRNNWWGTSSPTISYNTGATFYNGGNNNAVAAYNYTPFLTAASLIPIPVPDNGLNKYLITNVYLDSRVVNPSKSELARINFTLPQAANINIRITNEKDGALVKELSQNFASAGVHSMTWDGKDLLGKVVSDEAYVYSVTGNNGVMRSYYSGSTATLGGASGFGNVKYDSYKNQFWKLQVITANPFRSTLCAGEMYTPGACDDWNNQYAKFTQILDAGTHWQYWNGRSSKGRIITGSALYMTYGVPMPLALPHYSIIVTGGTPVITGQGSVEPDIEVKSNPYIVHHSYDEFSQISFQLDQNSIVTVKLLPPDVYDVNSSTAITFADFTNVTLVAETSPGVPAVYTVHWDGYDAVNTNLIQATEEGPYTFVIEATSLATGYKNTYRGALTLFH